MLSIQWVFALAFMAWACLFTTATATPEAERAVCICNLSVTSASTVYAIYAIYVIFIFTFIFKLMFLCSVDGSLPS